MKWVGVFIAALLGTAPLAFAGEKSGEIAWQDYSKAVAAAKKASRPVLIDFWRPG
jgi:hypothetical protein